MTENKLLYYDVTYKCNLRCLYCVSEKTNEAYSLDYDASNYRSVFDNNQNCNILHISGGEPTLFKNLIELCQSARKSFEYVLISTNGIKLSNYTFAKELINTNIDVIVVPFISINSDIHDQVVNVKGSFKRLITALQNLSKLCQDSKTCLFIKVLATQPGIYDLPAMPSFWREHGINPSRVQISGLHLAGKLLDHLEIMPSGRDLRKNISEFIYNIGDIPFSVYDLPWCILEQKALETLIGYGELNFLKDEEYVKINLNGRKVGKRYSHHFVNCHECQIVKFCNGYYPQNIEKIGQDLIAMIKPIKFV